jgi:hypothetical protein
MVCKPDKALGLGIGLVVMLVIVGMGAFLLQSMVGQPPGLNLYVMALLFVLSLPLLILWLYWYYGLATLRYTMDRNALVIACGASRYVVPMAAIRRVVRGDEVELSQGFHGVGWPGYLMGSMRLKELGLVLVASTEPLQRQLVVVTDRMAYGISPPRPEQFLADLAARQALGPLHPAEQTVEYVSFVAAPIWRDRWFWGMLLLAFVANAALFGFIALRYPTLPERLPLHFDARGMVSRMGFKAGLLVVPTIGALSLAANSVLGMILHARERLAAYLLAGMAVVLQVVLWGAALGILGR